MVGQVSRVPISYISVFNLEHLYTSFELKTLHPRDTEAPLSFKE